MRVAIYCRLSREDDDKLHENDESESIQNQKSMLINYAIERRWDIYNIYCDEDYSGIDSERPEFNKLLEDAKNHKFDIVLCKTQSRFTRDMEIVERYLHNKFVEWNIRFVSLVDHVDTLDKGNKKSRQINGLVNEWYLEDLSENIRRTFDSKRKQGLHIKTIPPLVLGYRHIQCRHGQDYRTQHFGITKKASPISCNKGKYHLSPFFFQIQFISYSRFIKRCSAICSNFVPGRP